MNQLHTRIATYKSIAYICMLLHCIHLTSAPVISFFFKPAPTSDYYLNKIKKPGRIAKYTLQGLTHTDYVSGIMATYAGYLSISETTGQLLFPRKQIKNELTLVVTPRISPVMRFEQTVDHWQLVPGQPIAFFDATLHKENKNRYWSITEKEPPETNIIDYSALIIFAKPDNLLIPLGNTSTTESPHLLLPDIYTKKAMNVVKHATYVLQMKHLFRQTNSKYKTDKKRYIQHIIG